jgi:hypothetical protein
MTNKSTMAFRRLALCAAPLMLVCGLVSAPARAQDTTAPAQAPTQNQTPTEQNLSQGQIEQLVAPIALYPDPLLTQVLMASTYPLEVIEAARWSHDNAMVKGQALQDAMHGQSWDPSVKALTAVPQTLQMMSDKLDWTQQLGDAFLAQQQDVLAAVQTLRAQASAAGNLQSTPQQVVTTEAPAAGSANAGAQPAIVIQPVDPDVYYVPVYNPAVAYGTWNYPNYQPFYWSPPGFVASNIVSFASGVAVGAAIWGGCDWWQNHVIINVNRFNMFNHTNINVTNNIWNFNPAHRGNVPYRNPSLAARFGGANNAAAREAFRDRIDGDHPDASRMMGEDQKAAGIERELRGNNDVPAQRDTGFAREGDRRMDDAASSRPDFNRPDVNRQDSNREGFNRQDTNRQDTNRQDSNRQDSNRQDFNREDSGHPHAAPQRDFMRSRAQDFRSDFRPAPRMNGGFHGHFGSGLRRL